MGQQVDQMSDNAQGGCWCRSDEALKSDGGRSTENSSRQRKLDVERVNR